MDTSKRREAAKPLKSTSYSDREPADRPGSDRVPARSRWGNHPDSTERLTEKILEQYKLEQKLSKLDNFWYCTYCEHFNRKKQCNKCGMYENTDIEAAIYHGLLKPKI